MVPELKAKLVAALRSGKYKQSTGALRQDEGYCCLGVGCDVHREVTGNGSWEKMDGRWKYIVGIEKPVGDVLPKDVMAWFGFGGENPQTKEVITDLKLKKKVFGTSAILIINESPSLAQLNDAGYTFDQIADIIERDF